MRETAKIGNDTIILVATAVFSLVVFGLLDIYVLSQLGCILAFFLTLRFINALGKSMPFRELIGMIMLIQMLVCPVIVYNYFNNNVNYPMDVDEDVYINFVFLGILFFLFGLFVPLSRRKLKINRLLEIFNNPKISNNNNKIGIGLVVFGLMISIIRPLAPLSLSFFLLLLVYLKFIGVFYLFFSNNNLRIAWIVVVYILYAYEIIGGGVFINLIIWGLMLVIILSFKYRFKFVVKIGIFAFGILALFVVQSFKSEYRKVIWEEEQSFNLNEPISAQQLFLDMATEQAGGDELYEANNLQKFVERLNQGWILAKVLVHVPQIEPYADGEPIKEDIRAAIIPRILDPSKVVIGSDETREKFRRFTGRQLAEGTRMTIGILGDGYANFGRVGGVAFMLIFGLFLNLILVLIHKLSSDYPTLLLWIPFIFFYAMRAGNEFSIILNYTTKSALVVYLAFFVLKNLLKNRVIGNETHWER